MYTTYHLTSAGEVNTEIPKFNFPYLGFVNWYLLAFCNFKRL